MFILINHCIARTIKKLIQTVIIPVSLVACGSVSNSEENTVNNQLDPDTHIVSTICNDGIDNDGDGLIDWQEDLGCSSQGDASEGGKPTNTLENGWTVFEPSQDTLVYFVSSSEGSDDNDGLSADTAFETYARAYQLARNNHPDWILLKRGDTFAESIDILSGRSVNEPFVISSYGDSTQRPLIKSGSSEGLRIFGDFAYLAVVGLDFYAHTRNPNDPEYINGDGGLGFRVWRADGANGNDLLIENCVFRYFVSSTVQGQSPPENITIRRNVMTNNYGTTTHAQGMYTVNTINLVFDENIMDHNGWLIQSYNGSESGGQATIFNHNTYFNSVKGLSYKNNALMRGSSMGSKFTAATEARDYNIENNLYLDNEIGIGFGLNYSHSYRFNNINITDNVISNMGQSRPTNRTLGWGIHLDGLDDSLISNNYIINSANDNVLNTYAFELYTGMRDVRLIDNIVHGISSGHSRGMLRLYGDTNQENISISNNIIASPIFARTLIEMDESSINNYQFESNTYFSSRDLTAWYELNNNNLSYDNWLTESSETLSANQMPNFCDSARTIEGYQSSIGAEATRESFINTMKQQGKFHWNSDYEVNKVNQWLKDGFNICQ